MLADLVSALVQADLPGAAACLAEDDMEWTVAAGAAEPDGMFGIGSVTKTFVDPRSRPVRAGPPGDISASGV